MGFLTANAALRGVSTIDSDFSPIVEANLWAESIFQAGKTYTEKYQTDGMGQLFVRRLGKGSVDRSDSLEFTHETVADELIPITLDEPFKISEPIYEAVETARKSPSTGEIFEKVVMTVNEQWQESALSYLVSGAQASADVTSAATEDTIKNQIISVRKELRENKAKPNVLQVSPRTYALILNYSGKEFQQSFNDEILRTGQVGMFLGTPVYENTLLVDTGASGDTQFIMYDFEAFSILTQRIAQRVIDAGKSWVGSAAQVHIISGFKVTTPERVIKATIA